MSASFEKAFAWIVVAEGGYVNDPKDPGGETKYGISKRAYPDLDIANLTLDQVKDIYSGIWDAVHGDDLPYPINIVVFDCAVNQGNGTAIKLLQEVLGVAVDGIIGLNTIRAAQSSQANTLISYFVKRALLYSELPLFSAYGSGWYSRLFKLARYV